MRRMMIVLCACAGMAALSMVAGCRMQDTTGEACSAPPGCTQAAPVPAPAAAAVPAAPPAPAIAAPAAAPDPKAAGAPFAKPGFTTLLEDGRLWVLREGDEQSEKCVTMVGAGPLGMTVKAADRATAIAYLAAKDGFRTRADAEGRVWVFRADERAEESEKHVTRIAAGPMGAPVTLKALSQETLDAYEAAQR